MPAEFLNIIPVLPSRDIQRDIGWYKEKMGFDLFHSDNMYAVLYRENMVIHLQWHADTADDPLLGGSVIRIYVKNLQALFEEFIERGTITRNKLRSATPWKTNEFGFYDLNRNAILIMEDLSDN